MRVLVACEFSGVVREAFRAQGHDAWSCDILPAEDGSRYHYQCNVLDILRGKPWGGHLDSEGHFCFSLKSPWELMIAHPPCTYLCSSGLHWNARRPERAQETEKALEFVRALLDAPIDRIALENPVGCISTRIRKPDQTIQPWQFGHPESKATCLWLKNLSLLEATDVLPMPERGRWDNQTDSGQNRLGPSVDRWALRAKTYTGIAQAMAEQWGSPAGCLFT